MIKLSHGIKEASIDSFHLDRQGDAGKKVSAGESAKIETMNYLLFYQRPHVHHKYFFVRLQ